MISLGKALDFCLSLGVVLVVRVVAASHQTLTDTFLSHLWLGSWKDS